MEICTGACSFGKFKDAIDMWSLVISLTTLLYAMYAVNDWKRQRQADLNYELLSLVKRINAVIDDSLRLYYFSKGISDADIVQSVKAEIRDKLKKADYINKEYSVLIEKAEAMHPDSDVAGILKEIYFSYRELTFDTSASLLARALIGGEDSGVAFSRFDIHLQKMTDGYYKSLEDKAIQSVRRHFS